MNGSSTQPHHGTDPGSGTNVPGHGLNGTPSGAPVQAASRLRLGFTQGLAGSRAIASTAMDGINILKTTFSTGATPSGASGRQRRDWVRADVRCIACARLVGRLLGAARQPENGTRGAGQPIAFLEFHSAQQVGRIVPFSCDLRFSCSACGGAGVVDDVEAFSTYVDEPKSSQGSDAADD
jgi:hypothetical protein